MPEKVVPGPVCEEHSIREAVCIHTKKIFDSCREEDIADLILPPHLCRPLVPRLYRRPELFFQTGTAVPVRFRQLPVC